MATEAEFRAAAARVRNWGRWGSDDELGTLNFITAEVVVSGIGEVRTGEVFALGTPLDEHGVWSGDSYRRNPIHLMSVDGGDAAMMLEHLRGWRGRSSLAESSWGVGPMRFNDDYVMMPLQAASQWDALAHVYYDGLMYNGVPATAVTSAGATRNSIDRVDVKGIAGRGVLLDAARHRGASHLPARALVEPEELIACAAAQGVEVRRGDILMVRTGWWQTFESLSRPEWRAGAPGLSWRCAEWFHSAGIAAVAADNLAVELVEMGPTGPEVILPLHLLCLVELGMMLGELWNFEALAAACAADGRWAMHLVAPPLKVTGAVGSPVNPIAIR